MQETFKFNNQTLANQLHSIKEAQRQFELTNMPFLTLSNFDIPNLVEGANLEIRFDISNIGIYPTKIVDFNRVVSCYSGTHEEGLNKMFGMAKRKKTSNGYFNIYASRGIQSQQIVYTNIKLDELYIQQILARFVRIYFWCEIVYTTEVKKGRKKLTYSAIVFPDNTIQIIQNESIDLP